MVMQRKHVLIADTIDGEPITQFMNERYKIPFHLSEQRSFLSNAGIAMRKSLSEQITKQINKM